MSEHQDGNRERSKWLSQRRNEGFFIEKINEYVYEMNGKRTNIKFANLRKDNLFWFNTSFNRLREIEVFVWLCGKAENYYVVPCKKMKQLVDAKNWFDKGHNRPEFCINLNHEYLPANIDISSYHQNLSSLKP